MVKKKKSIDAFIDLYNLDPQENTFVKTSKSGKMNNSYYEIANKLKQVKKLMNSDSRTLQNP